MIKLKNEPKCCTNAPTNRWTHRKIRPVMQCFCFGIRCVSISLLMFSTPPFRPFEVFETVASTNGSLEYISARYSEHKREFIRSNVYVCNINATLFSADSWKIGTNQICWRLLHNPCVTCFYFTASDACLRRCSERDNEKSPKKMCSEKNDIPFCFNVFLDRRNDDFSLGKWYA